MHIFNSYENKRSSASRGIKISSYMSFGQVILLLPHCLLFLQVYWCIKQRLGESWYQRASLSMHKTKTGRKWIPLLDSHIAQKVLREKTIIFDWHLIFSYNRATVALYSNGIPISIILFQSSLLGTVSKAFLKLTLFCNYSLYN